DRERSFSAFASSRTRFWHGADPYHAALSDAVYRRWAAAPLSRHRAFGAARLDLRPAVSALSAAPPYHLLRPPGRCVEQRLSGDPIPDCHRFGTDVGPRPGGEPAEAFLSARSAHRFRLFGYRRRTGAVGNPDRVSALRRDCLSRPALDSAHRGALR